MIKTRDDLRECLKVEKQIYRGLGFKGGWHTLLTQCEVGMIYKYIYYLRKDEYYSNNSSVLNRLVNLYYRRCHNKLGWKLGISIPCNVFDKGLTIYHSQGIIVHQDSRCGMNCKIHGNLCIENNGIDKPGFNTPRVGNDVDFGVGSVVIGGISIADGVKIAAGAVVCNTCNIKGAVLIGIPATELKGSEK